MSSNWDNQTNWPLLKKLPTKIAENFRECRFVLKVQYSAFTPQYIILADQTRRRTRHGYGTKTPQYMYFAITIFLKNCYFRFFWYTLVLIKPPGTLQQYYTMPNYPNLYLAKV
jgi:hypothetical protein